MFSRSSLRHSQHLLVNSLDRIDTLLELDILSGQLSLSFGLSAIASHGEYRLDSQLLLTLSSA